MSDQRLRRAGHWLGFGFGGFFDGILLHQVLQWHHLLSGLEAGWFGDLRHQVLADGAFHAAMYAVAGTGLVMLLRARGRLARPHGSVPFVSGWFVGFGAWHVVDAVLSHWLLGLHRVRMDTAVPLAWDVAWLVAFGLLPLAVGLWWRRRGMPQVPAVLPVVVLATAAAGWGASWRAEGSPSVVVMASGAPAGNLFHALAATDGRVVGGSRDGTVWLVVLGGPADAARLYRHGALYVSGTLTPAGCSAWLRATT